ncbi:hypothetical protein BDV40DRAFT_306918 [Aspergillus tamarii]|uniref:Uncharacterized protein n=1 Tax=Aspergillus tamarii TaxID=41984 RepID=A0A5N6UAA2_ASPTM|nr:hypothetical protein BDV40DRAFT_306918 [Aspergillus tamarii]
MWNHLLGTAGGGARQTNGAASHQGEISNSIALLALLQDLLALLVRGGNDPIDSNQQKLQAQLVRSLREHYPNIRQPPDGLIYERIRYYGGHLGHPRDVQAENDWWAALYNVPKTKKPMYLKAFLNHESFPQAFDSLLPIPGLWKDMHIGSLHTLVYMRCDEPIICALETILQTYLNLMGGNTDLLSHIDAHSVELLQSRAPKVSERDMRHLKEKMDKGELFPSMHDQNIRDGVWSRLQLIDVPIPTLATFFRDRRYLDVAKKVMSCLFQQDKDNIVTVDQGVSGVYGDGNDESIEDRNRKIRAGLRDLWRFSLQWGFEIVDSHKRRVHRGIFCIFFPGIECSCRIPRNALLKTIQNISRWSAVESLDLL